MRTQVCWGTAASSVVLRAAAEVLKAGRSEEPMEAWKLSFRASFRPKLWVWVTVAFRTTDEEM